MGGSRKSRPSFLQSLVLEVDLRADAEVTTHDVRTSPGRIEAEQAIGRVGIERRLGVEQVEHVRIDGELVTDLLRHGQVKIPDILDRKRFVWGRCGSGGVDLGGGRRSK